MLVDIKKVSHKLQTLHEIIGPAKSFKQFFAIKNVLFSYC